MSDLSWYTYIAAISAFGLAALCHLWYAIAKGCMWIVLSALFAGQDCSVIVVERNEVPRPEPYATAFAVSGVTMLGASLLLRALALGSGPLAGLGGFAPAFALTTALVYLTLEWRYRVRHLGLVILPIILALLMEVSVIPAEARLWVTALMTNLSRVDPVAMVAAVAVFIGVPLGVALCSSVQRLPASDRPSATGLNEQGHSDIALGTLIITLAAIFVREGQLLLV